MIQIADADLKFLLQARLIQWLNLRLMRSTRGVIATAQTYSHFPFLPINPHPGQLARSKTTTYKVMFSNFVNRDRLR